MPNPQPLGRAGALLAAALICAAGAPARAVSVAHAELRPAVEVSAPVGVAVIDGALAATVEAEGLGPTAALERAVEGTATAGTVRLRLDVSGDGTGAARAASATLESRATLTLRNDDPFAQTVGLRGAVSVFAVGGVSGPGAAATDFARAVVDFDTVLSTVTNRQAPGRAEGFGDPSTGGVTRRLALPDGRSVAATGEAFSLGTAPVLVTLAAGEARAFVFEARLAVSASSAVPPAPPAPVPLPAGAPLMLAGLGALAALRRRLAGRA